MIILLIATIAVLSVLIIYLNVQFYREKEKFKVKIEALHFIIAEISKKQNGQLHQIKLSEDIDRKLKKANASLSTDIFQLNHDLFELLSENNLLKK